MELSISAFYLDIFSLCSAKQELVDSKGNINPV